MIIYVSDVLSNEINNGVVKLNLKEVKLTTSSFSVSQTANIISALLDWDSIPSGIKAQIVEYCLPDIIEEGDSLDPAVWYGWCYIFFLESEANTTQSQESYLYIGEFSLSPEENNKIIEDIFIEKSFVPLFQIKLEEEEILILKK